MEKRYRFVKDTFKASSDKMIAVKGHEFTAYGFYTTIGGIGVDVSQLLQYGFVEEITPNKKPISSEENTNIENDIYSKKYNIYEILTLIPNLPKDTKFKCSLDKNQDDYWYAHKNGKTLVYDCDGTCAIEEYHELRDVLEATYTIVKPIEEVKERWIEIETHKDLCSAIANKKMIRLGDGKPSNEYNDKQIETLFGALKHGVFKLEYLEE